MIVINRGGLSIPEKAFVLFPYSDQSAHRIGAMVALGLSMAEAQRHEGDGGIGKAHGADTKMPDGRTLAQDEIDALVEDRDRERRAKTARREERVSERGREEPTMEEILASIRRILSEDKSATRSAASGVENDPGSARMAAEWDAMIDAHESDCASTVEEEALMAEWRARAEGNDAPCEASSRKAMCQDEIDYLLGFDEDDEAENAATPSSARRETSTPPDSEPTMEDILLSIRRILAEDKPQKTAEG